MYDVYYGLSGRPFQLTPDPSFYFESKTHRKALSYLGYGLAQGEGFIVITGEIGAGKTTLVGHLMQTINKARLTAAQIVTTQVASSDLLHLVARTFGLETSGMDKAAVLKTIEQFLHSEARAGRRCLLIVDESQNLPVTSLEELRMLSNFQLGNQALLQIFLLGQPEFRNMVQNAPELEQLRQRVIATHHLSAMEASEMQPYVEHRLDKVGWTGTPSFSDDVLQTVYMATGGIPRKVNALLSRVLLMGSVEQKDVIDANMVRTVLADLGNDQAQENRATVSAPVQSREPQDDYAREAFADQTDASGEQPSASGTGKAAVTGQAPSTANTGHADGATDDRAVVPQLPAEGPQSDMAVSKLDMEMMLERLGAMEVRTLEQERAIRRTLTMLVKWVENDGSATMMTQDRAA